MTKVCEIAVSESFKGEMKSVKQVETVAGAGLVNDRHFKNNNDKKNQVTLIEIENINYYNQAYGTFIKPINFRRNIQIRNGVWQEEIQVHMLYLHLIQKEKM